MDIRYEMGADRADGNPLLGRWAPNLTLHSEHGTTQVAGLMHAGRGVLIDLAGRSVLREVASGWADRVEVKSARCCERPANLDAMLIRPDGYIAWAGRTDDADRELETGLRSALARWFGEAAETGQQQCSATAQR